MNRGNGFSVRALIDALSAGVLGSVRSLSLAVLVFGGLVSSEARSFAPVLVGAGLLGLVMAYFSGIVGTPQSNAVAVVSVAAGIAVGGGNPETDFALVLATVAIAAIGTGVFLYVGGALKLGRLIRFLPYPVVGGFLAATGWLLVAGGVRLADGGGWTLPVSLLFAVSVAAAGRSRQGWLQPTVIAAAIGGFFVALSVAGVGIDEAGSNGWLIGPFPDQSFRVGDLVAWASADFGRLLPAVPTLLTVPGVAALSLLLNVSGIEVLNRSDLSVDRELKAAGLANVTAGLVGGLPGWQSITLDRLVRSSPAHRVSAVIVAVVSFAALLAGPQVIGYLPIFAIAGVVGGLGLDLLYEWLVESRRNVSAKDYAIVLVVVIVTALFGFVAGVGVGVVAAVFLFIVQYAKIDVVHSAVSGDTYRSNVDRSRGANEQLSEAGEAVQIVRVHGFVFFGTANRLVVELRERLESDEVKFLLIDGHRVTGFDGSAIHTVERFIEQVGDRGITTVLTGFEGLGSTFVSAQATGLVETFPTLDEGLEWAEDQILNVDESLFESIADQAKHLAGAWSEELMAMLERVEYVSGEVIIPEGSISHPVHIIEYGRVRVALDDGATRIRTIRPGAIVGELAYYTREPANASVIADTDVVAYVLTSEKLNELLSTNPRLAAEVHRRMAGAMARRITETNAALRKSME